MMENMRACWMRKARERPRFDQLLRELKKSLGPEQNLYSSLISRFSSRSDESSSKGGRKVDYNSRPSKKVHFRDDLSESKVDIDDSLCEQNPDFLSLQKLPICSPGWEPVEYNIVDAKYKGEWHTATIAKCDKTGSEGCGQIEDARGRVWLQWSDGTSSWADPTDIRQASTTSYMVNS